MFAAFVCFLCKRGDVTSVTVLYVDLDIIVYVRTCSPVVSSVSRAGYLCVEHRWELGVLTTGAIQSSPK